MVPPPSLSPPLLPILSPLPPPQSYLFTSPSFPPSLPSVLSFPIPLLALPVLSPQLSPCTGKMQLAQVIPQMGSHQIWVEFRARWTITVSVPLRSLPTQGPLRACRPVINDMVFVTAHNVCFIVDELAVSRVSQEGQVSFPRKYYLTYFFFFFTQPPLQQYIRYICEIFLNTQCLIPRFISGPH